MRDALIDTVLEKQSETNNAMRNVRENLEVMSRAGEGGPVSLNSFGSVGPRSGSAGGTSMKMSNNNNNAMASSASMNSLNNASGTASPSMVQMPSVSARGGSGGGSRKNSAAAPNQGTRASITSDDGDVFDSNAFGNNNNVNSVHGGDSMGSLGRGLNGGTVNYSRPTMAGQELRGMAPPMMSRESSMRGMMSKQSSLKGNNLLQPAVNTPALNNNVHSQEHSAPSMSARSHNTHNTHNNGVNLQLGSPNRDPVQNSAPNASARNTHSATFHSAPHLAPVHVTASQKTPPSTQSSHQVYDRQDSPGPAEFSTTMNSTHGGGSNAIDHFANSEPSPRMVQGVSVKAIPQQQQSLVVGQSGMAGNVSSVQPSQQQQQGMGQVNYTLHLCVLLLFSFFVY